MSGPTKSTASYRPPPIAEWAGTEAPSAHLVVVEGPDSGRHARVWLREGSFMLHHLDKRFTTRIGERDVDWAVLEDGDEIVIGPHRIRFETTPGGTP